jgi:hypothetical protein
MQGDAGHGLKLVPTPVAAADYPNEAPGYSTVLAGRYRADTHPTQPLLRLTQTRGTRGARCPPAAHLRYQTGRARARGRAMNRRLFNKRAAREARVERQQLVHAAGCVNPHCSSKWFMENPEWAKDPELAPTRRVSVPRSIRPILGSHVGGLT